MTTYRPAVRRLRRLAALLAAGSLAPAAAGAYPLDGHARSGIRRLLGYQAAQEAKGGRKLPPGALLGVEAIDLALAGRNEDWDLASADKDPVLQAALEAMLAKRDPSYAVVVVDVSDPERIAWAGLREDLKYTPMSVGKVLVMIGLFDALRQAFPDTGRRLEVLRDTEIEATDWAMTDSHTVPKHDPETGRNRFQRIQTGDRFRLSEWIDHMVSPSANAAGSTVWKEAMLLRRFKDAYPVDRKTEEAFFRDTPRDELRDLAVAVLQDPLARAGIDVEAVRQGTLYTRGGQRRVPGVSSYASPKELARILVKLEQGKIVDRWSSEEMKRYLYFTKKRYRYAYAPELADAAVYFKSGSYYRCEPEEGFRCGKYRGNAENLMNSIAIVESPARAGETGRKRYVVALMSNVRRVNSAWDHARIAAAVEQAVRTRQPAAIEDEGAAGAIRDAGEAQ